MSRKLGNDPNLWPQHITEYIFTDYPHVAQYMVGIKFKTVDPGSGTAMGGIMLVNRATGMEAVVPIIISEFELASFDVFVVDEDQYVPLTETRLVEYLGQVVGKLGKRKNSKAKAPVKTSPPGHGGGRASRIKTASMFEKVATKLGIGPGMLKILVDSMKSKDDGLVAHRVKHLIKDLPHRAVWISYVADNWVAFSSDDRFNVEMITGRDNIVKAFSKYDSNLSAEMSRNNTVFIAKKDRKPFIAEDHLSAPTILSKSGTAAIITTTNEALIGYYCSDITDLLGRSLGISLWYDGNNYTMGEAMTGYYMRDSHSPRVATLKEGMQYSFSFMSDGVHKATAPFTALEKPRVEGSGLVFLAKTHFGKEVTIKYSKEVEAPISSLGEAAADTAAEVTYYIPTKYKLNRVGNKKVALTYFVNKSFMNVLTENLGDSVRITGFNEEGSPHYYIKGKIAKQFITKGDNVYDSGLGKYAIDEDTLIWYLINLGFSEGTARSIIASVWENDGEVTVGNVEKFKDSPIVNSLPQELVSLAEDRLIPDESVESVLGLGFISDLDVLDSLIFIEEIKKLESILAKLLFQIRMGVPLADEKNVSRALEYVSKVIDDLEVAKTSLERKK
jgi:hypothetical protein